MISESGSSLLSLMILFSASAIRLATPLVFGAFGGYTSERAGVWNIALEGLMLVGAFFSAVGSLHFHNPWLGILTGCLAAVILASLHGFLAVKMKVDAILSGVAINLFASGLIPVVSKMLYDSSAGTPNLDPILCIPETRWGSPLLLSSFIFGLLLTLMHYKHRWGQYIRFAGEHPESLDSQGVSSDRVKFLGVLASGLFCGLGGAYLSMDHGTAFTRNMSAGRGFIALAALIMGRHTPQGALICALILGAVDALNILLQGKASFIPVQWIQAIPYIATICVLAFTSKTRQNVK